MALISIDFGAYPSIRCLVLKSHLHFFFSQLLLHSGQGGLELSSHQSKPDPSIKWAQLNSPSPPQVLECMIDLFPESCLLISKPPQPHTQQSFIYGLQRSDTQTSLFFRPKNFLPLHKKKPLSILPTLPKEIKLESFDALSNHHRAFKD